MDVNKLKKKLEREFDLSRDEDLSIALMNLVSLEEHFHFTAMKTGDDSYYDMLNSIRGMRTDLMKEIVKNPSGEEWCISKHLLATSMRLYEVGTKELSKDKNSSKKFFEKSFDLWSLFFAINLKLTNAYDVKKMSVNDNHGESQTLKESDASEKKKGSLSKFSNMMKKMIDCCKEW